MSSEQFGTNLRATATTSLPNLVRGLVVVYSSILAWSRPHWGLVASLKFLGAACLALSAISLASLKETLGVNLDFMEEQV